MNSLPLVTFSHLRWDFVYQRPQHVMSRIAAKRPVLFVEEPVLGTGEPSLELESVAPGITVARPVLPANGAPYSAAQEVVIVGLLKKQLVRAGWNRVATWLYTPMAVRMAKALHPRAILYDCMDDLSGFLNAPPEIVARERELMAAANAVMTGGQSLYRAKSDRHSFVRCFPSSVDIAHFSTPVGGVEPEDQKDIPRPRLGFCGVVDERMDLEILRALSSTHPEWQIVIVGPIVKIDPATLPRAENIHYLGQKPYAELAGYMAGWDVALMPFALNAATRFISPTKVLEYMAADRPIVSTPIADVADPYSEIVYLGSGPEGFVKSCEEALAAPQSERAERRARAQQVLSLTSWDDTARRMNEIICSVAGEKPMRRFVESGAAVSLEATA